MLVLALLLALFVTPVSSQSSNVSDLVSRLLNPDPNMSMELLVAALPSELNVNLLLPEGSQLLGSMVSYNANGSFNNAQVIIESSLPTQASYNFFKQAFAGAGWRVQDDYQAVGFVAEQSNWSAFVCSPNGRYYLYLNAAFFEGHPSEVRLSVNPGEPNGICDPAAFSTNYQDAPMPILAAPMSGKVDVHSISLFEDEASATASLETSLAPAEVSTHYKQQLELAGWHMQNESWTLTDSADENWQGYLNVSPVSEGRYFLSFVLLNDN